MNYGKKINDFLWPLRLFFTLSLAMCQHKNPAASFKMFWSYCDLEYLEVRILFFPLILCGVQWVFTLYGIQAFVGTIATVGRDLDEHRKHFELWIWQPGSLVFSPNMGIRQHLGIGILLNIVERSQPSPLRSTGVL